ncbi:MAG: hypothetical protein ACYTF6_00820 [Planctomycetota bacterium]|jgi:hypothetical protein
MSTVYRIRYKDKEDAAEAEALVKANSPTEALVKFRHGRNAGVNTTAPREHITSIYAEYYGEDSSW